MTSLYIAALGDSVGKTALSAGLGRALLAQGKRVGFLKPMLVSQSSAANTAHPDARFMKQVLGLTEAVETLCPCAVAADPENAKEGELQELIRNLRSAYDAVAAGKEVIIVEGLRTSPATSVALSRALGSKAILLASYTAATKAEIAPAALAFGNDLLGIVLNQVPQRLMATARTRFAPAWEGAGSKVLGILADDRLLFTLTIGELAQHLGAEILAGAGHLDHLVENLNIGALTQDITLPYLSRKAHKAVITRADRPDIQLAALSTDLRCLILAGPRKTLPEVLWRAEDQGVVVLQVKDDVITAMERIDQALTTTRFHQHHKLAHLDGLLADTFDFPALYRGLGVNGS